MHKALAVFVLMLLAAMASADVFVSPQCGQRTLTEEWRAGHPLNIIQGSTHTYRATECGVSGEVRGDRWRISASGMYGALRDRATYGTRYQSGHIDTFPWHQISGRSFAFDVGASRSVTPWLSVGTVVTVNGWSRNSGSRFPGYAITGVDYFLHDRYIAAGLFLETHRAFGRVELRGSLAGHLTHRSRYLSYKEEEVYLDTERYRMRNSGRAASATLSGRFALTRAVGIQMTGQHRIQSGLPASIYDSKPTLNFRSSQLTLGLSLRL